MTTRKYQICSHCVMDTTDSTIQFDSSGRCDYCSNYVQNILPNWDTSESGKQTLENECEKIRESAKGRDFDCIIGLSGGLDSSYLAHIVKKELDLRPLLFHVDAGWNTDQAVSNIEKMVDGLELDLYTQVINWEEVKDLQVAFLHAQIPHQDIVQDTAFFSSLYQFARRYKIKYVLTGGNYSTECCREPDEWGAYPGIDRSFILDVHKKFGNLPLATFPITDVFTSKIYYRYVLGMKVFKPLDLIPFIKKDAEEFLESKYGWSRFQHKHHESRFTRFLEDFWLPRKFGFDRRRAHFSSLILTGQMTRDSAIERLRFPELDENFLLREFEYVANKLGLSVAELEALFAGKNKTINDYGGKRKLIQIGSKTMKYLGLERRLYR